MRCLPSLLPLHRILFSGLLATALWAPARAAEITPIPVVTATHAWVRWLPAGLPAGGYMTLHNFGTTEVVLTSASCPDYGHVMLHESYTARDGTNRMRRVDRLRIPPGGSVSLQPGGYHLMLMRPKHNLKPGDTVVVTLHFESGQTLKVKMPLKPPGTQ